MSKTTVRKYGKSIKKSRAEELFAELPRSPIKRNEAPPKVRQLEAPETDSIDDIADKLLTITLEDGTPTPEPEDPVAVTPKRDTAPRPVQITPLQPPEKLEPPEDATEHAIGGTTEDDLRVLTWDDVCQFGDRVEKIAEASYAEVYRITNERGTSIIKAIRLQSPIKPQTKTQQKSGLVDEEPHSEADLEGELKISEWLADIPGFVVYKERYVVKGRAPKALLETHQVFHRKMKRKDPDRLQFYPSPSRYLDDTKFLVVELGDAGTALEDFELRSADQLWDIFLHTAIALARAEDLVRFEVRNYLYLKGIS
jgi:serine/threonine-protein kinase haspin